MPNVTYISHTGETTTIDVPVGTTVMENAVKNGIEGIVGECGGAMLCATCHVYVDPAFLDKLDPIGEEQDEMLGATAAETCRCCTSIPSVSASRTNSNATSAPML